MREVQRQPRFDGTLCRAARALVGLSQMELSVLSGCGRKLLNDFENGLVEPKPSKIEAMRQALEREGAVFVRVDEMLAVGLRPGGSVRRPARGRAAAREADEGDGNEAGTLR